MTSLGNGNYRGIVLDLIYILIAMFFFVLCWLFTKNVRPTLKGVCLWTTLLGALPPSSCSPI